MNSKPYRIAQCLVFSLAILFACDATAGKRLSEVGVSVSDLSNPFFVAIARSVERAVAEFGIPDVQVTILSNSYDLPTQIRQLNDFVAAGVQMIVLNAADPNAVAGAIQQAKQAGIVVIALDVAAAGADVTVTSDNRQAGELACNYLAERLKGHGNVVILNGPLVSSVIERVAGCKTVLARYPNIRLLSEDNNGGGSRKGGIAVMTQLLFLYPQIDAVFAINDPSALGADLAARLAARTDLFIVSIDGSPSAKRALGDEDSLLAATVAQDPYQMTLHGIARGIYHFHNTTVEPETILIPTRLVTRRNVALSRDWIGE